MYFVKYLLKLISTLSYQYYKAQERSVYTLVYLIIYDGTKPPNGS